MRKASSVRLVIIQALLVMSVVQSFSLKGARVQDTSKLSYLFRPASWGAANAITCHSSVASRMATNDDIETAVEESIGATDSANTKLEKESGFTIFGLSPTNPQDWITVFLTGVIVYETFDLAVFWFQKLTGFKGFESL